MLFQYSETQTAIGTSNVTDTLCEDGLKILNANDNILTPNNFYEIFGPAGEYEPEPERGYTVPSELEVIIKYTINLLQGQRSARLF